MPLPIRTEAIHLNAHEIKKYNAAQNKAYPAPASVLEFQEDIRKHFENVVAHYAYELRGEHYDSYAGRLSSKNIPPTPFPSTLTDFFGPYRETLKTLLSHPSETAVIPTLTELRNFFTHLESLTQDEESYTYFYNKSEPPPSSPRLSKEDIASIIEEAREELQPILAERLKLSVKDSAYNPLLAVFHGNLQKDKETLAPELLAPLEDYLKATQTLEDIQIFTAFSYSVPLVTLIARHATVLRDPVPLAWFLAAMCHTESHSRALTHEPLRALLENPVLTNKNLEQVKKHLLAYVSNSRFYNDREFIPTYFAELAARDPKTLSVTPDDELDVLNQIQLAPGNLTDLIHIPALARSRILFEFIFSLDKPDWLIPFLPSLDLDQWQRALVPVLKTKHTIFGPLVIDTNRTPSDLDPIIDSVLETLHVANAPALAPLLSETGWAKLVEYFRRRRSQESLEVLVTLLESLDPEKRAMVPRTALLPLLKSTQGDLKKRAFSLLSHLAPPPTPSAPSR